MRSRQILQNAYVVRDLDVAMRRWREVAGAGPFFVNAHAQHPSFVYRGRRSEALIRTALTLLGSLLLELMQQVNDAPSVLREVLDARGEGFHHIKIECTDFDAEVARFKCDGYPLAFAADIPGQLRFAFFDTLGKFGHFTEISETFGRLTQRDERITEICAGWDGRDPIRDIASLDLGRD